MSGSSKFILENHICDYVTGNNGANNAIREMSELCMGLLGGFDEVIRHRMEHKGRYAEYLSVRNAVDTQIAKAL